MNNRTLILPDEFMVHRLKEDVRNRGVLRVSDPRYDRHPLGTMVLAAKPGRWTAYIEQYESDSTWKPASLTVHHEELPMIACDPDHSSGQIMVDSGQVGVFDDGEYDEVYTTRYRVISMITTAEPYAGCFDAGVVVVAPLGIHQLFTKTDGHGVVLCARINLVATD